MEPNERLNPEKGMQPAAGPVSAAPETDAAQDAMRLREENLTQREADLARRELHTKALAALAARQMPAELAELLDYADENRCTASLSRVQRTWQQAVQKGVEARVAGAAPRTGAGKSGMHTSMRDAISAFYNR